MDIKRTSAPIVPDHQPVVIDVPQAQASKKAHSATGAKQTATSHSRDRLDSSVPAHGAAHPPTHPTAEHMVAATLASSPEQMKAALAELALLSAEVDRTPLDKSKLAGFLHLSPSASSAPTSAPLPSALVGATFNLAGLVESGQVRLPADVAQRLLARRDFLSESLTGGGKAAVALTLAGVPAEAQQAAQRLALIAGPHFQAEVVQRALKGRSGESSVREEVDLTEGGAIPASLRSLLGDALPGFVSALHGESDRRPSAGKEEAAPAHAATPPSNTSSGSARVSPASRLAGVDSGAPAHSSDIEIPGPAVVALEQSMRAESAAFAGMDVMEMVQLVMMECERDAGQELVAQLKLLKKNNAQKAATRAYLAGLRKQEAAMRSQLRSQYDSRVAIARSEPPNPLRIDPAVTSFDAFCETQKLALRSGDINSVDGELPADPSFTVSPNVIYYSQNAEQTRDALGGVVSSADEDLARKVGLAPATVAQLRRVVAGDRELLARFGSLETFLAAPSAQGGLGLRTPPAAGSNPESGVATWLAARAARDASARNDGLAEQRADIARFRLTGDGYTFLRSFYDAMPAARRGRSTFSQWLADASMGPGLREGADNRAALMAFQRAEYARNASASRPGGAPAPVVDGSFVVEGVRVTASQAFNLVQSTRPGDLAKGDAVVDAARGRIPSSADRQRVDTEILRYLAGLTADVFDRVNGRNYVGDYAIAGVDGSALLRCVSSLPADARGAAMQYAQLRLAQAVRDLHRTTAGTRDNSSPSVQPGSFVASVFHDHNHPNILAGVDVARSTADGTVTISCVDINGVNNDWFDSHDFELMADRLQENIVEGGMFVYTPPPAPVSDATPSGAAIPSGTPSEARALTDLVSRFERESLLQTWTRAPEPMPALNPAPLSAAERAELDALKTQLARVPQPEEMTQANAFSLAGVEQNRFWQLQGRYLRDMAALAQPAPAPGATTYTPDAATRSQIDAMQRPVDHSPPTAERVANVREMTLGELNASIEEWEGRKDTLGDFGQEISVKMQIFQDRYAKFTQMLSNMMKKAADTEGAIIANMK